MLRPGNKQSTWNTIRRRCIICKRNCTLKLVGIDTTPQLSIVKKNTSFCTAYLYARFCVRRVNQKWFEATWKTVQEGILQEENIQLWNSVTIENNFSTELPDHYLEKVRFTWTDNVLESKFEMRKRLIEWRKLGFKAAQSVCVLSFYWDMRTAREFERKFLLLEVVFITLMLAASPKLPIIIWIKHTLAVMPIDQKCFLFGFSVTWTR